MFAPYLLNLADDRRTQVANLIYSVRTPSMRPGLPPYIHYFHQCMKRLLADNNARPAPIAIKTLSIAVHSNFCAALF